MTRKTFLPAFCALLLFAAFYGCQKSNRDIIEVQENVSTSISGRVLDVSKSPVAGAIVTAGTATATTDVNGNFKINNVSLNKSAAYVKVQKEGYFAGSRTIVPTVNSTNNVTIELITKTVSGSFSGNAGGSVPVTTGGNIVFPADGVVNTTTNASYTGNVSVSAFFLNPTAANFTSIMPGDLRGITTNNEERGLQSFGMMAVELNGSAGEKLQLAPGKTATITFPIPASMQATAPATIPLWYFDEVKGLWKEEGTASKQGGNYVGTVSHFSYWNCDVPYQLVNFEAVVKDAGGNVLPGVTVSIKSTSDSGMVRSAMTDSAGKISGLIPANKTLNITIYNKCNTVIYAQNLGPFSANANLGNITTTATVGALITIAGSVTNCTGGPVANGFVNVAVNGQNYRANVSNGTFTTSISACTTGSFSASVYAYDIATNVQGAPITVSGTTGTAANTTLSACGITANQYINYTIGTTSYSIVPPSDSIYTSYFSPTTYISGSSKTAPYRGIYLGFSGTQTPGTKALAYVNAYSNNLNVVGTGNLNVTITQYGNVNDYITGSFAGTVKDSVGTTTYPIQCNFRVKRTQ